MAETLSIVIKAVDKTKDTLAKIRSNFKKFEDDFKSRNVFKETLEEAEKGFRELGGAFQSIGLQAAALGGAITVPLGFAVKKFMDFEHAMKNVQAVSGATQEEFEQLSRFARKLGATTAFSATEAAEAMYYLASAGWKTSDMMKGLPGLLNLAAATQTDLAQATDVVVATLSQFGLKAQDAQRVADVFTAAISNSQATMTKLQYSMRYVGPLAHALGLSLEETTAGLMALYNAGYQGEQAGTMLRNFLARLINPSKDMLKYFAQHNVQIYKNADEVYGLVKRLEQLQNKYEELKKSGNVSKDTLKKLQDQIKATKAELQNTAVKGLKPFTVILSELQRTGMDAATITQLFGQEVGPGVAALLGIGADKIKEFQRVLEGATGAASKTAKQQLDSLWGTMKILQSAAAELALAFGSALAPTIKQVAQGITKLVTWFNNLDPSVKNTIARIAMYAGIGLTAFGTTSLLIGGIMKATSTWLEFGRTILMVGPKLKGMIATVKTLNKTMLLSVVKSPFLWISVAAVGLFLIVKYWDQIVAFMKKAWNWLLNIIGKFIDLNAVSSFFKALWEKVTIVVSWLWQNVLVPAGNFLKAVWISAVNLIANAWSVVSNVVSFLYNNILVPIGQFLAAVFFARLKEIQFVWVAISDIAVGFYNDVLVPLGKYIATGLKVAVEGLKIAWDVVSNTVSVFYNTVLVPLGNFIAGALKTSIEALKPVWEAIKTVVNFIYSNVLVPIGNFLTQAHIPGIEQAKQAWETVKNTVLTFYETVLVPIGNFISTSLQTAIQTIQTSWEAVKTVVSALYNNILVPIGNFLNATLKPIVDAIKAVWDAIANVIGGGVKTAVESVGVATEGVKAVVDFVAATWNGLKATITAISDAIQAAFSWAQKLSSALSGAFKRAEKLAAKAGKTIVSGFKKAGDAVKKGMQTVGGAIASGAKKAWNVFTEIFKRKDAHKSVEENTKGIVKSVDKMAQEVSDRLPHSPAKKGPLASLHRVGFGLVRTISDGIRKNTKHLIDSVESLMNDVDSMLPHSPARKGPLSRLGEVGFGFVNTLAIGISSAGPALIRAVDTVVSASIEAMKSKLRKGVSDAIESMRAEYDKFGGMTIGENIEILFKNLGLGEFISNLKSAFNAIEGFMSTGFGKKLDQAFGGVISKGLSMIAGFLGGPAASTTVGVILAGLNAAYNYLKRFKWFREAWEEFKKAFRDVWNQLKEAFKPLGDAIAQMAPVVTSMLKAMTKLSLAIFLKPLISILKVLVNILKPIISILVPIIEAIVNALDAVSTWISNLVDSFIQFYDPIAWIGGLLKILVEVIGGVVKAIGGIIDGIAKGVGGFFGGIFSFFKGLFGFAEGGLVTGPGTATSDNLLARLSPGEFVVNAESTKRWYPVLKAINEGKEPPLKSHQPVYVTINVYDATDPHKVKEVIEEYFNDIALQTS